MALICEAFYGYMCIVEFYICMKAFYGYTLSMDTHERKTNKTLGCNFYFLFFILFL